MILILSDQLNIPEFQFKGIHQEPPRADENKLSRPKKNQLDILGSFKMTIREPGVAPIKQEYIVANAFDPIQENALKRSSEDAPDQSNNSTKIKRGKNRGVNNVLHSFKS